MLMVQALLVTTGNLRYNRAAHVYMRLKKRNETKNEEKGK